MVQEAVSFYKAQGLVYERNRAETIPQLDGDHFCIFGISIVMDPELYRQARESRDISTRVWLYLRP